MKILEEKSELEEAVEEESFITSRPGMFLLGAFMGWPLIYFVNRYIFKQAEDDKWYDKIIVCSSIVSVILSYIIGGPLGFATIFIASFLVLLTVLFRIVDAFLYEHVATRSFTFYNCTPLLLMEIF